MFTDRSALAREAKQALQTLPQAEEEDYMLIVQVVASRLRGALDEELENLPPELQPAEAERVRLSRDAAHWVIRKSAQELARHVQREPNGQLITPPSSDGVPGIRWRKLTACCRPAHGRQVAKTADGRPAMAGGQKFSVWMGFSRQFDAGAEARRAGHRNPQPYYATLPALWEQTPPEQETQAPQSQAFTPH
ncbi:MAG: hypothetical protein IPO43_08265 [Rhodoferax sp.]|nr:hypothetical protein [Rhodoferax sp.]